MGLKFTGIETAEKVIAKAGRETKKNIELLNSDKFFSRAFMKNEPHLTMATKEYITCIKRLKNIETDGWLSEFKEYSKNIIQAFDLADNSLFADAHGIGEKHPIYRIIEAIFCASLFREEGLQRRFKNVYSISKNIIELNKNEYFLYAVPYIYYVNTNTGSILRCTKKIENFECFWKGGSDIWYNSNDSIYEDGERLGKWIDATYYKRSGGKRGTVYKNITFSTKNYLGEYGGKSFTMPAHHVVVLCYYGIFILKNCIGAGSLMTIDHLNGNSIENGIMNLAVVSRAGNSSKGSSSKEKVVNFLELFENLHMATTPYEYHKKYFT